MLFSRLHGRQSLGSKDPSLLSLKERMYNFMRLRCTHCNSCWATFPSKVHHFPMKARGSGCGRSYSSCCRPISSTKIICFSQSKMLFCCKVQLEFIAQVETTQLSVMFCKQWLCSNSTILFSMPEKDFSCHSTQNIKKWPYVLLHLVSCFLV